MKKLLILFVAVVAMCLCACNENSPISRTQGMLSGKFSVSATEQVQFSQGNLQYQASTGTWRFAENQYDMIGGDNSHISTTYTGWIDLFGWGTGNNPTETSTSYYDYSTFRDWGKNAISNGGNKANMWRTLTKDEWVYLFYGRTNAATLFGLGSVNGVNGTILLPDNWNLPAGASFTASTTQGLTWYSYYSSYYYNSNDNNFTHNAYTKEQWSKMESAGAVFLPAAGRRHGTNVFTSDSHGSYWSATSSSKYYAYHLEFNSSKLEPEVDYYGDDGRSVRLVR